MKTAILLMCFLLLPGCSSDSLVTEKEHQAIKSGMNLKQVAEIVGFKGELTKENKAGTMPSNQAFVWNSSDGSRLIVFFVQNKVLFSRRFTHQEVSGNHRTPLPIFK